MKYIFAFLFIASLTACSGSSDNKKSDGQPGGGVSGPGGNPNEKLIDKTDYSVCGNYTPTNLEIDSNGWKIVQRRGEFDFQLYMNFNSGFVRMGSQCSARGRYLSAEVSVRASAQNGVLEFLSADRHSAKINEEGFKMNCDVSVERGSMNYTFKGRCLELSRPGYTEKIVMVPL